MLNMTKLTPDEPQFDVAISFLASGEPTVREIYSQLDRVGLKIFFFPRSQEELAGTNGLESMRSPFLASRLVVVLFRKPWGETPWTRVEQMAITDRCLERGWESLLFVVLDETATIPKWLPETHVRFNFQTYGMEQALRAIKFRVQQLGGLLRKPSSVSVAKRLKEEEALRQDQTFN
jgi:hypothetical protein